MFGIFLTIWDVAVVVRQQVESRADVKVMEDAALAVVTE